MPEPSGAKAARRFVPHQRAIQPLAPQDLPPLRPPVTGWDYHQPAGEWAVTDAGLCERMVWVIEKFDPATDAREVEIVIDALLFRFISRLVGLPSDLRFVTDHRLDQRAVSMLAARLHLYLDLDDEHTVSCVRYDPGWDGAFIETWLLRSSRHGIVYSERYLDDVVHRQVQQVVGAPSDARFDTWHLESHVLPALRETLQVDIDLDATEYYISYLRTECLPPIEATPVGAALLDWRNGPARYG